MKLFRCLDSYDRHRSGGMPACLFAKSIDLLDLSVFVLEGIDDGHVPLIQVRSKLILLRLDSPSIISLFLDPSLFGDKGTSVGLSGSVDVQGPFKPDSYRY